MGRVRITRPFVLLALVALLAPRIEASRTGVWGRNPPAAAELTTTNAAGLLASLAPAAAADVVAAEMPAFDLGDVALVESELEHENRLGLGPLELLGPAPLRGPPASYPETRVRGFELLPPFRVGASPSLSLWSRQACGFSCREVVSDSRYDPWGLWGWDDFKNAGKAAFDWAANLLDFRSKGRNPQQEAAEQARREGVLDPGMRVSGDVPGGFANKVRDDFIDVGSTGVAVVGVVGKEAVIYYSGEKVGEFAARVVIGGVTKSFRTIQEAANFARERGATARYVEEGAVAGTKVTQGPEGRRTWEYVVSAGGERGPGYRKADVPAGMHKGHVRSVREGAGRNPVDDSPLNVVAQTPTVNLSNVKRFEAWRASNAAGRVVRQEELEGGLMRVQIPDLAVDVTYDPNSTARWPDEWFLSGGTWR
jgi:hypothetical protein